MAEPKRDEKEEEKRGEKQEEKKGGWEEKWRRDRGNAVTWAAILIWGALVLWADTSGYAAKFSWWEGWAVFLAGMGIIVLIEAVIRLLIPAYRKSVIGSIVFGCVLLGVGLGGLVTWNYIWVVVLIIIALLILLSAFRRRS